MQKKTDKNISSGAEKVERIEQEGAQQTAAEQEHAAARARVEKSRARAAKREQEYLDRAHRQEEKLHKREENAAQKQLQRQERAAAAAEKKAHAAEARAAKRARRELMKSESAEEAKNRRQREKKERLAARAKRNEEAEKKRAKAQKERESKRRARASRRESKRKESSNGGWLAAVISLGVACLALATVVTAGAFRISDMTMRTAGDYRATLYEMVSVSEDMDNNLAKLNVSSGTEEQRLLLTQLLVDSAVMESAIEKMPFDGVVGSELSAFVNRTGDYSRDMLTALAAGKTLGSAEKEMLRSLAERNSTLYRKLNELATHLNEKDFLAFLNGQEGALSQQFRDMGEGTLASPEDTSEAPFTGEGNVGENMLTGLEEISMQRAEETVREALSGYRIADAVCTGETHTRDAVLYNFTLMTEEGGEIFAQITKQGGKLAFFDTYEPCSQHNFDLETCDSLAREFLAELGYDGLEAVWLSEADSVADITYVGVQDGVRVYPDMIRVRVCEERGRVTGISAMEYLLNHTERTIGQADGMEEARGLLGEGLTPYSAHVALIPMNGEERLAYEFACTCGEEEYLVYLDAETGDELQIYRVRNSAQGSYLR